MTSAGQRCISADGFTVARENVNVTYQRVDTSSSPETNFSGRYYGKYVKTTSAGKFTILQVLESVDCQQLRGQTVRLQVKLKANVASQTWRLGLLQLTSAGTVDTVAGLTTGSTWVSAWNGTGTDPTLTAANNVAYIAPTGSNLDNTTAVGNALNCAATTSWQRFGGTFTVPTDCKNLIFALWSDAQEALNDGLSVTEASLTVGTDIIAFVARPYPQEMERVRRYIVKTFEIDQQPVQNLSGGAAAAQNALLGLAGKSGASTNYMWWRFPVSLFRDGLTDTNAFPFLGLTRYNTSAANALVRNLTTNTDMGAVGSIIAKREETTFTVTGVGGGGGTSVGDQIAVHLLVYGEL